MCLQIFHTLSLFRTLFSQHLNTNAIHSQFYLQHLNMLQKKKKVKIVNSLYFTIMLTVSTFPPKLSLL